MVLPFCRNILCEEDKITMTKNDVMCLGWAYGYLSDFREVSSEVVAMACMRPLYGLTQLINKMKMSSEINSEMDEVLTEILSGVNTTDKNMDSVISLEFQGIWWLAYYRGKAGAPLKFNIAERRKQMGLTQNDLAEQLGVTQAMISRWENDVVDPSPGYAERLRQILG